MVFAKCNHLKYILSLFLIFGFEVELGLAVGIRAASNVASAAETLESEIPQFVWKTKGRDEPSLRLKFADGREAVTRIRGPLSFHYVAKIEIGENLCQPQAPPAKCQFEVDSSIASVLMGWTTNPDPERLKGGGLLKYYYSSRETERGDDLQSVAFSLNLLDSHLHEDIEEIFRAVGVPQFPRLRCDSYAWLSGAASPKDGQRFQFLGVGSEKMETNHETGIEENRVTGESSSVTMRFDQASNSLISERDSQGNMFFISDATTISFLVSYLSPRGAGRASGARCQISASMDRSSWLSQVMEAYGQVLQMQPSDLNVDLLPKDFLRLIRKYTKARPSGKMEGQFR